MSDSENFYNKLRVRRLVNAYLDHAIGYAGEVGRFYRLSEQQTMEVLKMTVASKLPQLTKTWKKVQPVQPSFSNVPDGDYVGDLKEMILAEAKKSGRLQVKSTYEVADGDYVGNTVKRFDGLDNETSMGYFKGYCEIIGMDIPEDLELLQETMDAFVAGNSDLFNMTVKTNGQFVNVYVNGVSEFVKSVEGEGEQVEGEEGTEEVVEEGEGEQVEEVIEEVVEEVVEQEITQPTRKTVAKTTTKPIGKVISKPVPTPIKKVVTPTPIRKVGTIKKK